MTRRKISLAIRLAILQRDGSKCVICGRGPEDGVRLEVDHITPLAAGGTDDLANLRTLCGECNKGKSDRVYGPLKPQRAVVAIPVPADYAVDQVKQSLRYFEQSTHLRSMSIDQLVAVIHTPGVTDGINPLFWPLPKEAVLTAVGALERDGKVQSRKGIIEIVESGPSGGYGQTQQRFREKARTERKVDLAGEIIGVEPRLWLHRSEGGGVRIDQTAAMESRLLGNLRQLALQLEPEDAAFKHSPESLCVWLDRISNGVPLDGIMAVNFVDNVRRFQDALATDLKRWRG